MGIIWNLLQNGRTVRYYMEIRKERSENRVKFLNAHDALIIPKNSHNHEFKVNNIYINYRTDFRGCQCLRCGWSGLFLWDVPLKKEVVKYHR